MPGLKVPVFFGSILALIVLVIQNRTPVFELTLLGMRSRSFSLGIWVALAVITGVFLGAILQRTGIRREPRPRAATPSPSTSYDGPTEYQPFRSIPDPDVQPATTIDEPEFDEPDLDGPDFERPISEAKTKGWNTEVSKSWTAQAEQAEDEGRFWSRPRQTPSPKGNVTPIQAKRNRAAQKGDSVVDAEYRIVPPESSQPDNGFDDKFFDDFFDEEDA